jgi:hypothetical protein
VEIRPCGATNNYTTIKEKILTFMEEISSRITQTDYLNPVTLY